MNWLAVLAGGHGERFWPLSRRHRPKQFLRLLSDRTMLQETVDRLGGRFDPARIFIVTGQDYVTLAAEQLPTVLPRNILGEPIGRNTAASVAWAAHRVLEQDPDGILVVLPSDHAIARPDRFRAILDQALNHVGRTGQFALFGIVPNRPDTGFGYIEADPHGSNPVHVRRFVEKPDLDQAREMLATGRFYWNSGMFVLPVAPFWETLVRLMPELAKGIEALTEEPDRLDIIFPELPAVSLDVGIMERARDLSVFPTDIGWDDVGTFQAVARILVDRAPDRVVFDRVEDVVVIGDSGPWVAGVGLSHLVIVRTPDVVMILPPEESQAVRHLVERLKRGDHRDIL